MIFNAIVLSVVTFIGMALLFYKLPVSVRKTILKFDLFADIACAVVVYLFLGGTATAIIAAGLVGIYVSVALSMSRGYVEAEREIKLEKSMRLKKT